MYFMNTMNISNFNRNGNAAFDAVPVCVTVRGRPFLNVRPYFFHEDKDIGRLPWFIVSSRSAGDWREFFKTQDAQAVTLDDSPSFVIERWTE